MSLIESLKSYVESGRSKKTRHDGYDTWRAEVAHFLGECLGQDVGSRFLSIRYQDVDDGHKARIGFLKGILAKLESSSANESEAKNFEASSNNASRATSDDDLKQVFIVHGHDNAAKQELARFCERIGLLPIILHEKEEKGRTIIEKLEDYSNVRYAVVLLTPDDIGSKASKPADLTPRARQNVVFELGYFIGRLGRSRVSAMRKNGVELPSDYHGIVYVLMDDAGAWRTKLAQEFVHAGLTINLEGLLQ